MLETQVDQHCLYTPVTVCFQKEYRKECLQLNFCVLCGSSAS